ncbi:MAG: hypothetical protein GX946_08175 [Oligosphaeraceae bacterium]|nr:hypothetical protein [Oligosphaeraceae bacterium]
MKSGRLVNFSLMLCILCGGFLFADQLPLPYGAKILPGGDLEVNGAIVRRQAREIALPCRFVLAEGALEVIVSKPDGRMHETLLCTDIAAVQVQALLYLLGAENGSRLPEQGRQGDLIDLFIEWQDDEGKPQRQPVEYWIIDTQTGKNLKQEGWVFVGSTVHNGAFLADLEGNIVINYSVGSTVLDSPNPAAMDDDTLHVVDARKKQPQEQNKPMLVLKPRQVKKR